MSAEGNQTQITRFFKPSKDQEARSARKAARTVKANKRQNELAQLKEFDFDCEFGPCMNISRMERWERAANLGLNPPENVKKILMENLNDEEYTTCTLDQRKLLQLLA